MSLWKLTNRKSRLVLVSLLVMGSINSLYGDNPYFSSFWDFYSDNRGSNKACGRGWTGVASLGDISSVIINPASLNVNGKYQPYLEYIHKDKVQWLKELFGNIYLKDLSPNLLAGFGFKIDDCWQSGLLYSVKNSYRFDYGEEKAYDNNGNPVGIWHAYDDFKLTSFTIPIVFNKGIIRGGVSLNYNRYSLKRVIDNQKGEADFDKFVPEFGIILSPAKNLSFGLTYLPQTEETVVEKWNNGSEYRDSSPNIFPSKIRLGMRYKLDTPISFLTDYNYSNDSKDKSLIDRDDLHFGLEYYPNKSLTLRTGFFDQKDYRKAGCYFEEETGDYDQRFITLGASYKIRFFTMNLALADSQPLSYGKIEQRYINAGMSFDFGGNINGDCQ